MSKTIHYYQIYQQLLVIILSISYEKKFHNCMKFLKGTISIRKKLFGEIQPSDNNLIEDWLKSEKDKLEQIKSKYKYILWGIFLSSLLLVTIMFGFQTALEKYDYFLHFILLVSYILYFGPY